MKYAYLKNLSVVVCLFVISSAAFAQKTEDNIIKINVPALLFKNFSFQYERAVGKKQSFAVAVRYRPKSKLPFEGTIEDAINDTSIKVKYGKVGNFGITPEYRFYLGKKGALHGFYIGPFLSYNNYTGDVPIKYYDYVNNTLIEKVAIFNGSANSFTGGVQIGAQWQLSQKFFLDWWILGLNYGFHNGSFQFDVSSLNSLEKDFLDYEMKKIEVASQFITLEITKRPPSNDVAQFKTSGPWAGIRAFGINLGYRF